MGHALRETSRAPDWSFHTSSELNAVRLEQPNRKGMEPGWIAVDVSHKIHQTLSKMANYIHGYRIIKDISDGEMFLRIKPKVRYTALRHLLEHMLHQWTVSKHVGNASFASTGSMGNNSALNIVDHIYRYRRIQR